MMFKNIVAALAVPVLMLTVVASIAMGFALYVAKQDLKRADEKAAHWKQMASKAYVGYLMAMSPVASDGTIHQVIVPKGSRYENGMLLPPDYFCEKGLLQCKLKLPQN